MEQDFDRRDAGRRWHDMGGTPGGRVLPEDHDFALWEKRVDALVMIAQAKGLMSVDGLRRVLEDMGEDAFERMSYYERWVSSLNQNLVEAGTYSLAELAERMHDIASRGGSYGEVSGG